MTFCGSLFDMHPRYQHFKTLMMDFFRGQTVESMEIDGLQHIICCSVAEQELQELPPIAFRVYLIRSKKVVGSKVPRIELEEMGPRMDLKLGRWKEASEETMSMALKKPKETVVRQPLLTCSFETYFFCRSRRRRMLRSIRLEINLDGFI